MHPVEIKQHRLYHNYSMTFNTYEDGSWRGAIVTAAGIVLAYSDVRHSETHLLFAFGGIQYDQWIDRPCTPRGAAIRAGRFVRQVVRAQAG